MSEQSWWQRAISAINREYDRRIRRASLVSEYGAGHHGHSHADHDGPSYAEHDDGEVAAIMNVPKGTRIGRPTPPEPTPDPEHPAS